MLVPPVRASTAWLPIVLLVGVVVLIKKEARHLCKSRWRPCSVRHLRWTQPVSYRSRQETAIVSQRARRFDPGVGVRRFFRSIDVFFFPGRSHPRRRTRRGGGELSRGKQRWDPFSWFVGREKTRSLSNDAAFLRQNVEMVYTAVALRTLRIADVTSPPRGGGLASERFAPAPAALQSLQTYHQYVSLCAAAPVYRRSSIYPVRLRWRFDSFLPTTRDRVTV